MADVFDKEKRSSIMQCVRSKGNKSTEIKLIQVFAENGITGWRRNYQVKGHPDFVFPKRKIAVFVDGCFWHGHDCRNTRPPIIKNIGKRNESVTSSTTLKLLNCLRNEVGQLSVSGSAN